MKKRRLMIGLLTIGFMLSGCGWFTVTQEEKDSSPEFVHETEPIEDRTGDKSLTAFEKDKAFLIEKELDLLEGVADSELSMEDFLDLLSQTYESLDMIIDTAVYSPNIHDSEAVKKMTMLGVYDNYFPDEDTFLTQPIDYGTAGFWLMTLQDVIQERTVRDNIAVPSDLLHRINVATALLDWTEETETVKTFTLDDMLEGAPSDIPLTKLMAAEIMVKAYEETVGTIPLNEETDFADTENVFAMKSAEKFFWTEDNLFHPEQTGDYDDWGFMPAIQYSGELLRGLNLEEQNVPYGAAISSLAQLLKEYEEETQVSLEERIVLNEKPYHWHVYQFETGEHSYVNCMPACIEMALRYQGIREAPTAEELRDEYPLDGEGWNDSLTENVMNQYGLEFQIDWDVNLERMLTYLEQGNILYVMYREPGEEIGHSVMIKGYWQIGETVQFIISDPAGFTQGRFGYIDRMQDAATLIPLIQSHVPRYFVIPSNNMIQL